MEYSLGEFYILLNPWKAVECHAWSKRNLAFHWRWLVVMVYHLQCEFIADLGVCISLTCGECLLEWALLCSTHGKHWPENWSIYVENQRNWLLQNPSGWNLNPLKGVGVVGWALMSWWYFSCWGSTATAQCSHRGSAWGPFQNPAGQPRSLEKNLEDADKKPKTQKEPWFWMHLLSHTAPSSVCCFSPVPQAIQGLTLVLVQLSRKQKKILLFLLVLKHYVHALKGRRNK